MKAGVVVTSRLPKADNTSMAGGRGLLQWYQSHGPNPMCRRGRWAPERGGWRYPTSGVEENEPRLISVGIAQPIEAYFEDKTVRVGMVVAPRLPEADNNSMAGGRRPLSLYQGHEPEPVCQRGRCAPERGMDEGVPHRELRRTNHAL